jgi:outer membrane usher protein FimD/PapC
MKRIFALLIMTAICASVALAGKAKVEAAIAVDKDTKPTTTFTADVPKLYAFFRSKGTQTGDKLRGVWIAEDVGDAAPKKTKIDEATLTADENDFYGAFSLTKPTKGWPAGKYRVDIYVGDELATTAKFTIKSDEDSEDESKDDSSEE